MMVALRRGTEGELDDNRHPHVFSTSDSRLTCNPEKPSTSRLPVENAPMGAGVRGPKRYPLPLYATSVRFVAFPVPAVRAIPRVCGLPNVPRNRVRVIRMVRRSG